MQLQVSQRHLWVSKDIARMHVLMPNTDSSQFLTWKDRLICVLPRLSSRRDPIDSFPFCAFCWFLCWTLKNSAYATAVSMSITWSTFAPFMKGLSHVNLQNKRFMHVTIQKGRRNDSSIRGKHNDKTCQKIFWSCWLSIISIIILTFHGCSSVRLQAYISRMNVGWITSRRNICIDTHRQNGLALWHM